MRLSKHFLNDYVDLTGIDYHDLASRMVFTGNEYESIDKMCNVTGIVVGYVVECINHPESDHLHICQVDLGTETKQIICGAPNVAAGQKVIVATVGAQLPGGVIKRAHLAGMDSEGMICSLMELGIDSKYLSENDKIGIHILGEDAEIGSDPLVYLQMDDEVIDFELTADRGDLMSILGMAYEVGAIYNLKVMLPDTTYHASNLSMKDYSLEVETKDCSIYLGKVVNNVVIKESPGFIKNRLIASGIRPINNVVDISNYVMLEYGQPLHFFDALKLGKHIIVRNAEENETLTTLDNNIRTLNKNDIVIANETEAVALAGVMGGLTTEVETDTKDIFIEAAIFDPIKIRLTSNRILRSEASNRYEKGIDPNRTLKAIERACHLLEKYASASPVADMISYDNTLKEDKKIVVHLDKINQVLGMELTSNDVKDTLNRLDFKYTGENPITVFVPTRRIDVNIVEDLIAEIGKIYGYDKVVGKLPIVEIKQGHYTDHMLLVKNTRKRLQSLGLQQVITYSLTRLNEINDFVIEPHDIVEINNYLSEDRKVMRQSMIRSLMNVYDYNASRGQNDVSIFECGSSYYKIDEKYIEESKVAGLMSGEYIATSWGETKVVDFYLLKGIIENLLGYLGFNNRYQLTINHLPKEMHPGRSAMILLDNEEIGFFGEVSPMVTKKRLYVFEFSLTKILNKKVRSIKYKEVSKYPSVHKDLAFIVKKDTTAKEIEDILKRVGSRLLTEIKVFDVYTGDNVGEGEKSIAFALTFQDQNKTLTDEEVTNIFNKMIESVESKLDAKLRDK